MEDLKMLVMKELNNEMLAKVIGGKKNVVHNPHKGYSYVNCRREPRLDAEVYFTIPNGTEVFPTGNVVHNDGIDWYEINLAGAYTYGWVAGHLIGR